MLRERCVVLLALCVLGLAARAAGATPREDAPFPRGVVVDRVVCRADSSKSYALYLPSAYTPDRAWPILYCFDPDARGREPVARFAAAAERFGWIVAGSYDSRNGLIEESIKAGSALWTDTHERLKIDDRRAYTAGFSGGARVATFAALSCGGCIAGVIACGAGFPESTEPGAGRLPQPISFAYFATIGSDDFNFPELKTLDGLLAKAGVPHEVARWEGPHDWAPEPLCTRAVAWMEMRAMRAATRARDDALVRAVYAERIDEARAAEAAGRPFDAWLAWTGAAGEFAGLIDVAEPERRAAALGESKEVRAALAREQDEIKLQAKLTGEAIYLANTRADQDDPLMAKHEFQRRIAALRKSAHAASDSSERRVARRALHQVFAYFYEGGLNLAIGKKYARAEEMFEVAADIAPQAPEIFYQLASAQARAGDAKRALATLRRAVEKGFGDADRLRADPAFAPLRADPAFASLLQSVQTAGH